MIIEKKKKLDIFKGSLFQQIYLEADDDEKDENNITVRTNSSRGTDYDDGDNTTVRPSRSSGTDYDADDDNDTSTDNSEDNDTGTDNNDNTSGDTSSTTDGDTDYDADDADGDDGADGDTDYDSEEGGEDEENSEDSSDDSEENNEESNNDPLDTKNEAKKKFSMYKKYVSLYKNIDVYNDRIQNIVKDEPIANAVLKTVSRNLTDLKDNLYDFMTIKFQNANYIQILTFFETSLAIVKLNFELLRNNKINLKQ